jgi:hypothetical protein
MYIGIMQQSVDVQYTVKPLFYIIMQTLLKNCKIEENVNGENVFTVAAVLLKICLWDQQVVLFIFPYYFLPNISLVLWVASQVDT